MHHLVRTVVGAGVLLAAALLATRADAQTQRGEFGGPYYRGANNPSAYYRDFERFEGRFPGPAPFGGYGRFGGRSFGGRGFAGRPHVLPGDAFGAGVAGPFGRYAGYGNYYTADWYDWRW